MAEFPMHRHCSQMKRPAKTSRKSVSLFSNPYYAYNFTYKLLSIKHKNEKWGKMQAFIKVLMFYEFK